VTTQILLTGIVLIALGVGGYLATGAASVTALIPAFIGAAFALLGLLGRREALRRHAMHVAMLLALLAIAGTFGGITDLLAWPAGTPPERPAASVAKAITALLCCLLLVAGVRSFLASRRAG
jgi:hypothetical protein